MPDDRKKKYGMTEAPSSYQKGGKNDATAGSDYKGTVYYKDSVPKKAVVEIDKMATEATDPDVEYKLKNPYQKNRADKYKGK